MYKTYPPIYIPVLYTRHICMTCRRNTSPIYIPVHYAYVCDMYKAYVTKHASPVHFRCNTHMCVTCTKHTSPLYMPVHKYICMCATCTKHTPTHTHTTCLHTIHVRVTCRTHTSPLYIPVQCTCVAQVQSIPPNEHACTLCICVEHV